jgi:hypothetical protein
MAVHYGPSSNTVYTFNDATYYIAIDEGTSGFGGTLYGNATKESGYVSLTTNVNSQNGQLEYTGIYSGNRTYATFDSYTGGYSGVGADAIWYWWGATTRPSGEDSNSGGYLYAIDEYQDQLQLNWAQYRLENFSQTTIDDATWHSWIIEWKSNTIKVWRDGSLKFTEVDSARTIADPSSIGFGGRTGGYNNHHRVRNMKFYVSTDNGSGY